MNDKLENIKQVKMAVMIDGDNAQPSLLSKILTEAGKYGSLTIRRIYGDWTTPNMKGWKKELNFHAIQPIQQFRYTVGKNATDSAMIIDAMDILLTNHLDGFCIVSSDSDYTRLATRIREEGVFVMGIGKKSTPRPFVNACNVFIYTENLEDEEEEEANEVTEVSTAKKAKKKKEARPKDAAPLLKEAYNMAVQEDGWALLATMGTHLHQLDPGFDPRSYGFKQLSQLLKALPHTFEMKFQDDKSRVIVYVRVKE